MGGSERGVKALGRALSRILPIALRERAGAEPRGFRPRRSNLLDFAKIFQIGRSAFVIPSTRDALGWAGNGEIVTNGVEEQFRIQGINETVKSTFARNAAIYFF